MTQAPLFAGYLYSSIARIESLPYVFPWDCLQWQVSCFVDLQCCVFLLKDSHELYDICYGSAFELL